MRPFFQTENLTVGYDRKPLIRDINISLDRGKILTLIGPNGAGKTTILKTLTRQIPPISGSVFLNEEFITGMTANAFAKLTAVVLTGRETPELMSCEEVVSMGRYPYTGWFGTLSEADRRLVREALETVHALDIAGQDFATLSDGQKQRILLARAICQEPELLILDEPTAYLDIRYKLELLEILQKMTREKDTAVILSLHEIDLAMKISDTVLCLKGSAPVAFGAPEDVLTNAIISDLYDISGETYNILLGSVELPRVHGAPEVFVISGSGSGTPFYRRLQKKGVPFAAGILYENDIDVQAAKALSDHVFIAPAFQPADEGLIKAASELLLRCAYVIDAGTPVGPYKAMNKRLLDLAKEHNIPVKQEI